MDRLESLGNTLSQITLYDIKSMYNQAKNVVLNVSEMEAKVREATNDEPWGASTTLMQDIANGTFNFQNFNEIMPCIYARFMEKEARQWRQIYKALQLLEFLIKHGSERVVDDARSHISTLKMLRNFHYIDEKGKDQGLNVRNRSRELVELLMDVDKIRAERRKAKANKHKYTGTGNDDISFGGSRYGGFGNESYSSGGGYDRDYGGGSGSGFRDDNRRGFQEYNAGDDEIPTSRRSDSISQRPGASSSTLGVPATPTKQKEPVKEVNLLDGFDDDDAVLSGSNSKPPQTEKALPALGAANTADDDFADFIAAPSTSVALPAGSAQNKGLNLMEMLNSTTAAPSRPSMSTHTPHASFSHTSLVPKASIGLGVGLGSTSPPPSLSALQPSMTTSTLTFTPTATTAPPKPSGGFDDLWTMSLGNAPANKSGSSTPKIKDLQKEKAEASIWGSPQKQQQTAVGASLGSFGVQSSSQSTKGGVGAEDLLL